MTSREFRESVCKQRPDADRLKIRSEYSTALWSFAQTDGSGRFELSGLLEQDYRLGVLLPVSLARVDAGPFTAGATNVRIQVAAGAILPRVAGQVVGMDGTPIAGVQVLVAAWPTSIRYRDRRMNVTTGETVRGRHVTTDAEGRFAFDDLGRRVMLKITGEAILSSVVGGIEGGPDEARDEAARSSASPCFTAYAAARRTR